MTRFIVISSILIGLILLSKSDFSLTKPLFSPYEVHAFPLTSELSFNSSGERKAPFSVINRTTDNYLVNLKSLDTDFVLAQFFIRAGETLETKLPIGQYQMSTASGQVWYGFEHHFG